MIAGKYLLMSAIFHNKSAAHCHFLETYMIASMHLD
jgi:hypothetical protein